MWKTLSKAEARKIFNSWEKDKEPRHSCENKRDYQLREQLLHVHDRVKKFIETNEKDTKKRDYFYDLRFGLELYDLLNRKYRFSPRIAANEEVWIYISMKVVPDLVFKRWGLTETRFFSQSRRIWLRTLWWYIYLSWNDTFERTYEILRLFTTDEIAQLVERSGPYGYRVDVTREIMNQLGSLETEKIGRDLFRKIMKLNTARVKIIEPALVDGGVKKYVADLINYFEYTDGERQNETKDGYITSQGY